MVIHDRKHWSDIIQGQDYTNVVNTLTQWQKSKFYPHSWDAFSNEKLTQDARDKLALLFQMCRDHGWYNPMVREDKLTFMSLFPTERFYRDNEPEGKKNYVIKKDFPRESTYE